MFTTVSLLVGEALAGDFLGDLFPGLLLRDRGAHLHRQDTYKRDPKKYVE